MTILNRDALLKKAERRYTTVTVEGGDVRIQSITELERSHLQAGNFRRGKDGLELDGDKLASQPSRLLALCVVDEAGQRILSAAEAAELDAAIASTLVAACRKHCGLDDIETSEGSGKNSDETGG